MRWGARAGRFVLCKKRHLKLQKLLPLLPLLQKLPRLILVLVLVLVLPLLLLSLRPLHLRHLLHRLHRHRLLQGIRCLVISEGQGPLKGIYSPVSYRACVDMLLK
jgi:hypothetical protein